MASTTVEDLARKIETVLPRTLRRQAVVLANSVILVARGIRTATLIDTLSLKSGQAKALDKALECFGNLVILHELDSGQTLVADRRRLGHQDTSSLPRLFIDITDSPPRVIEPPTNLRRLVDSLKMIPFDATFHEIHATHPLDMVSLAGVLLDYPTIYCIDAERARADQAFLSGVELTLLTSSLELTDGTILPISSFTCPAVLLTGSSAIDPERDLREGLQTRLQQYNEQEGSDEAWQGANVRVEAQAGVVQDRVAI